MKILIVEDDLNKLAQLRKFATDMYPSAPVTSAFSYNSGLRQILSESWSVVLLDMQLPTFDKSPSETGGRQRALAGQHILRRMVKDKSPTPVVIVTQFERFGEGVDAISLTELVSELTDCNFPNYVGTVYYNANTSDWKLELKKMLSKIQGL